MNKENLKVYLHIRPVFALWQFAKKTYRFGHKAVTASRAAAFFIWWSVCRRRTVYGQLKLRELRKIKAFRPLRWKHGACYFTADYNGKKVFIKTGGKPDTIKRESEALRYASVSSAVLKKHIPVFYLHENFIIEEYVEGKSLSAFKESQNGNIITQLYSIYEEMKKADILHLDIRPDNFIVTADGEVVLIDFGFALFNTSDLFAMIPKSPDTIGILKGLGSRYSPHNGTLDDAYSMLLTMKYVEPSLLQKFPLVWKQLNEDIGTRVVKTDF